ncbi:MAG TPA: Rv2231c family pyridoxal phosphate-dependent protein CobC [Kineosporiaceae bacterium]|nr:Rv2231c family pyridoxal phosphate-dependent protein CobC [Kineosporiaceae bacterium]
MTPDRPEARGSSQPPLETTGPPTGGISIAALGSARAVETGVPVDRVLVGIGARRGVRIRDLRMAMGECLAAAGVRARDVVAIVSVDAKQSEPALQELAEMLNIPLRTLPADQLAGQSVPNPSAVTEAAVGTPSVAEAAVLAFGGELVAPKHASHGVTIAVGRLPVAVAPRVEPAPSREVDDLHFEDLRYHGDAEIAPGLVDLAVNVRETPAWLKARLRAAVDHLAAYPNSELATAAIAARHARPVEEVLLTAGAAEAFVLLAHTLAPDRAVVVHPQFTEPEAALNAAGHSVQRVVLEPPFVLHPELVPDDADLVFIGNPTNPTSVLHPTRVLLALARPGRVLVVDEAFMDAVPGESETLSGSPERPAPDIPGLVVIRSLTKTWGLAGLRIGYLLGDPELLQACRANQPLWSVGSLGLEAAIACSTPEAVAEADRTARSIEIDRQFLLNELGKLSDIELGAPPQAPFVLLRALGADPVGVHQRLRAAGWAVRRADTFPGLAAGWLRIAVRDQATSVAFAAALDRAVHSSAPTGASSVPTTIDLRDAVPQLSENRKES